MPNVPVTHARVGSQGCGAVLLAGSDLLSGHHNGPEHLRVPLRVGRSSEVVVRTP